MIHAIHQRQKTVPQAQESHPARPPHSRMQSLVVVTVKEERRAEVGFMSLVIVHTLQSNTEESSHSRHAHSRAAKQRHQQRDMAEVG